MGDSRALITQHGPHVLRSEVQMWHVSGSRLDAETSPHKGETNTYRNN